MTRQFHTGERVRLTAEHKAYLGRARLYVERFHEAEYVVLDRLDKDVYTIRDPDGPRRRA